VIISSRPDRPQRPKCDRSVALPRGLLTHDISQIALGLFAQRNYSLFGQARGVTADSGAGLGFGSTVEHFTVLVDDGVTLTMV